MADCQPGRAAYTVFGGFDFGGESPLDTLTRQSLVQRYYHYQWQ